MPQSWMSWMSAVDPQAMAHSLETFVRRFRMATAARCDVLDHGAKAAEIWTS